MIKTNNIGFKGFVKNLKKLLNEECQKQLTHSESLEAASHLFGYKNYNLFNADNKHFVKQISSVKSRLEEIKNMILINPRGSLVLVQNTIVEDLNIEYRSKFDKLGRYLDFNLPTAFDEIEKYKNAKVIIVKKDYFGSIRSTEKEMMPLHYSFDEQGIPSVSSKSLKELELFADGFYTRPFVRHNITASVNIAMKNKTKREYDKIDIRIAGDGAVCSWVFKIEDGSYSYYRELHYNDKVFCDDTISHEELKELAVELGFEQEYAFKEYLKNYETELKKENKTLRDEYTPRELNMSLLLWIIEKKARGFFDAVFDIANMIMDYEIYDEFYTIREDFYLAYKDKIAKGEAIELAMYSRDIETIISRRDNF